MTGWDNLVRTQVLQVIGNDVMPNTSRKLSKKVKPRSPEAIDLKPDVNLLVTWAEMNYHRQVQTQYACLAQMSDHIPGLNSIKVKGNLSETITKYAVSTYKTRPQCFDSNRFFPKTYSLRSLEQCREFFEIFNSEEYQIKKAEQKIVYFRKMGSGAHGADGVFAVDDQEEISIRALYGNGALCGEIQDDNLMQYSVHNPMLLNGRKFDFRIYMLIASVNPKIVYYHDGLLRVSLTNYDINNLSKFSLMPNSDENDEVIRKARLKGDYKGKTAEEIREEYMWSLERLRDYLLENGYISDPEWLDTYLRPAFKKAMIHLVRMAGDDYLKISSVYELHGLDFILDENLKLWFIETNCRPAIEETTPFSRELFRKMFLDQYEIVIGLLRSRMKRVYEYVNHVIIRGEAVWGSDGKVHVKNKQDKLKEFKEVIKNYFEPEFEPRKGNSFSKIMDENLSGVERFSGLISKECL